MILAHNKSLLKYLFDAIQERKISTVGYYVGGMKEEALKQSETKQIIIATYSMASEGLDIKSLTTLIMATPKTEIEQTVGRILREKHSQPVVVDIIDHQPLFQNQWQKRKLFYKKQNYKIIHTDNSQYQPNTDEWDVLYDSCNKINGVNDKINGKNRISLVNPNDDILKGKCFLKLPKTS
jgi:superfamily II DNA or RNA helicase